ncbi:MAG: hypothetical protein KAY50_01620 [Chitinophagaceae bacterium]|nr:hypothetical protein [Chitinophagaceae bacterium]
MSLIRLFTKILIVCASQHCLAQADSLLQSAKDFPEKYIPKSTDKVDDDDRKLSKQTLKLLKKSFFNKIKNYLIPYNQIITA